MNQQFVIIWSVLALSQIVYLFIPAPPRGAAGDMPVVFPIALGTVALVQGVGIVALLRIRAFNPIQDGRLDPRSKEGAAQLFTTLILAWVLAESVAVYGLLLRFLHFDLPYSAAFAAAGALLLFLGRPWHSTLRRPESKSDLAKSHEPITS